MVHQFAREILLWFTHRKPLSLACAKCPSRYLTRDRYRWPPGERRLSKVEEARLFQNSQGLQLAVDVCERSDNLRLRW